ncbi:hypothetical protein BEN47_00270 [Hymenobacter lapidarius]|uniref:Uncharacterized protein n=1 Tax=Hymenobacter lapidarius TaxID=1908237 RepID=A0A1G1T9V0_9BACT|nr:hypothetical protein [Hymenobacter lapidarius]OGX87643.1 hypothetical protein BEN47_00270 [Hymenobacter lapidarius]
MGSTTVLATLAAREEETMRIVVGARGSIEFIFAQLQTQGIYDEYSSIHQAYAQLLNNDQSQEAVKRALFIQWYCLTEPSFLSGISDIDELAELAVLTHLDHLLRNDQADTELVAMLRYYSTWEFVFQNPHFQHLVVLQSFVIQWMSVDSEVTTSELGMADMDNRGQMGKYWLSINWLKTQELLIPEKT